jgi:hypothetical protein
MRPDVVRIPTRLAYDPNDDPHTVGFLVEYTSPEPLSWSVSRDLLAAGLVSPQTGQGWVGGRKRGVPPHPRLRPLSGRGCVPDPHRHPLRV